MEYIVNTPCGPVRGTAGRVAGTVAYKGIRYATAGRWEYPRQVTGWAGVYDASAYGHCSYQPRAFYNEEDNLKKIFYYNEFRRGETYTYSEDCLFLNVFTPENAKDGDKLPVLVYIHGGGFTGGCGHEKHFDGPVWPAEGIIGVTLNYRLGPMGFVCLPQLAEETGGFTGNYGLYDQMTAILWVKDNIAAFGGDPENITIMGQSAGAASVQLQSCSPMTKGLFQKAVMSSGCGLGGMLASTVEKSCAFWQEVMTRCGCKDLEQFRALPVEKLFEAWQTAKKEVKGGAGAAFPVQDGRFSVAGAVPHDLPYMAGSTSHDMAPPVLQSMARKWIAGREKPGYTWYFDRMLPGDDNGAWHSSDLWYWFGTLPNCWRPMERKDYDLSRQMVAYLCNFARTGNPNHTGELPTWVASGKGQHRVMILGEKPTAMGKPSMVKMICTMLTNKAVGE
ncbi:MAG: carboxylesterase family protein [Ruminococcaceae bacterium]|nr:carboxylesterase family protein [Oscillospiraceae bacterium]